MKIVVFPRLVPLLVVAALITGCSSHPDRDRADRPENPFKTNRDGPGGPKAPQSDKELRLEADQLYRRASSALTENDYTTAIERYNQLIARYPFSDYSTQAELEKIYAQYRNYQPDEAVSGADRFLREHPRHPHADYIQYIKGLTDASRDESFTDFLPLDSTKKDVSNARRSYDDFALLLQRYPNSAYTGDARKRMVYLRNRVADHELSVVKFYVKRGAFVAAAKRCESIIAEYPGAPATAEALKLLEQSNRQIGLTAEADEAAKLIAANPAVFEAAAAKPPKKSLKVPVVITTGTETPAAPEAVTAAPPKPKSLLERIVSKFNFLDSSKPENTYTLVLPSAGGPATAGAAGTGAATAGTDAGTTPTTGHIVHLQATVGYGDQPEAAATPAAAAPATTTTGPSLQLAPSLAGGATAAATASDANKADSPQPPQQPAAAPAQKRGLLTRFVDLFSFLDPNRNGSEKPAAQPAPTKVDNTGATVPATTPDK